MIGTLPKCAAEWNRRSLALRREPGEVVDRAYLDGAKTALNYAERGASAEAGLKAAHEWLRNRQTQFANEKSAIASSQAGKCEADDLCGDCKHAKADHAGPDWSNASGCCENGCECRKFRPTQEPAR